MDFSYIFRQGKLISKNLTAAGFSKSGAAFLLRRPICGGDFYAVLALDAKAEMFFADVYDSATNEKYALFDMKRARGAFVAFMREEVRAVVDEIQKACFERNDIKEKYAAFIKERFGAEPDFPWEGEPDYSVFRHKNGKWFALIMKIKFRQIGLESEEPVWVVNVKADPEKIPALVDKKSIFPAWHMNKKHWITILLTAATDFEALRALTERSAELVGGEA